jgi:hypothetical protein
MPRFDEAHRNKPIAFDPAREKFLLLDEIASGREPLVPLEVLSEPDFKRLVVERIRRDPSFAAQSMSGPIMTGEDAIRAIDRDEPFGRQTVEADRGYLRFLHQQIAAELESRRR